jgi:transposase-like protein
MKPLTTLGDALMAKGAPVDWRAELRAAEVPRRPPPASETRAARPDRGYVEQPEERVRPSTGIFPRRREETPTLAAPVALIRFNRDENHPRRPYMDPVTGQMVDPNAPPKSALESLIDQHIEEEERKQLPPPMPEPASCVAPAEAEEAEMAKPKKPRRTWDEDVKSKAVARVLSGVTQAAVAREIGTHETNISQWVKAAKQAGAKREKTQLSRPTPSSGKSTTQAIASMVRSTSTVRSFETVSAELQEALNRVKELKRELRGLLGDD